MNDLSLIEKVGDSGLLGSEDVKLFLRLKEDVRKAFFTTQVFRTRTEAEVSVLNDAMCPTADSKYWQATREQDVHATELVFLSFEYRKAQVEIKKIKRDLEAITDPLEREEKQIELEKQQYVSSLMERQAHHRLREVQQFAEIRDELKPHLRYGTEDVNAHQLEAMRVRWTNEAKLVNEHTPVADARNILGLAQAANKAR